MLSEFDIDEQTARTRVKEMKMQFGIREFEFYNVFEGYSHPPDANAKDQWYCRCFNRPVFKQIVQAYIDEINQEPKGRAWLSIQMMGSDPDDSGQQGFLKVGSHSIDGHPLLDVIVPTVAWAEQITRRWAAFANSLDFSGVNWATMGDYNGTSHKGGDLPGFLRTAKPILKEHGLDQIGLFIDGFGWEEALVNDGTIEFTYWSLFNAESQMNKFFSHVTDAGVFTSTLKGAEEDALKKLIWRWQQAICRDRYYFALGDGHKRLTTDYYPAAKQLESEEIVALQGAVSGSLSCDGGAKESRLSLPMQMPAPTKPPPPETKTKPPTTITTTTLPAETRTSTTTKTHTPSTTRTTTTTVLEVTSMPAPVVVGSNVHVTVTGSDDGGAVLQDPAGSGADGFREHEEQHLLSPGLAPQNGPHVFSDGHQVHGREDDFQPQALPLGSWSISRTFGSKRSFLGVILGTALLFAIAAVVLSGGCCWLGRSYRKWTRVDLEFRGYDPASFISHPPRTVTGDEPLDEFGHSHLLG
jgi:hypothetical protein